MDTKELGNRGENLAAEYLIEKGFRILERNWRISFGEIDIIARKKSKFFARTDKTIHFMEVKTILGNIQGGFFPEQHVDWSKQRKLQKLCQIWLADKKLINIPYQIDVVGVLIDPVTQEAQIEYFDNAVADTL